MDIFQIDATGRLFISPDIDDWQAIEASKITIVFDLDDDLDIGIPEIPDQILYLYFPFADRELPDLHRLHAIARLGAGLVEAGYKVLSHCGMGHNRSALLAGVILTYLGLSGAEAVALIRQKRQGALYNKNYASYLEELPSAWAQPVAGQEHPMSFDVTQDEILQRLAQEYDLLVKLIDQFTPTQMQTPGLLGSWTVLDLLAHLIAHEQRALLELHSAQQGQPLQLDHAANDSFNDGAVFACRLFDGPTLRAAWEQSYRRVVETVAALPPEIFLPNSLTVQTLADSIDGALSNNTYAHYAEHRGDVERWLHTLQTTGD